MRRTFMFLCGFLLFSMVIYSQVVTEPNDVVLMKELYKLDNFTKLVTKPNDKAKIVSLSYKLESDAILETIKDGYKHYDGRVSDFYPKDLIIMIVPRIDLLENNIDYLLTKTKKFVLVLNKNKNIGADRSYEAFQKSEKLRNYLDKISVIVWDNNDDYNDVTSLDYNIKGLRNNQDFMKRIYDIISTDN